MIFHRLVCLSWHATLTAYSFDIHQWTFSKLRRSSRIIPRKYLIHKRGDCTNSSRWPEAQLTLTSNPPTGKGAGVVLIILDNSIYYSFVYPFLYACPDPCWIFLRLIGWFDTLLQDTYTFSSTLVWLDGTWALCPTLMLKKIDGVLSNSCLISTKNWVLHLLIGPLPGRAQVLNA